MTALWVLLGLVALLLMLAWMPVGAAVTYDSAFRVRVQVGFLRFTVYPAAKEGKKEKKGKKKQSEAKMEKKPFSSPNRWQIRYSVDTLVPALWRALVRFGRRIRVPLLRLHVVFGGEDPADVAVLYGKSQAVAAALLPLLEGVVRFGETDVQLATDYRAERTVLTGEINIQIRLWALAALGCSLLKSVVTWLRGYRALKAESEQTERKAAGASSAA